MSENHLEWSRGVKAFFVVAAIVEGALLCGLVKFAFDDWRATLDSLLIFSYTCLWTVLLLAVYSPFTTCFA